MEKYPDLTQFFFVLSFTFLAPLLLGFSPAMLDNIHIMAIRDMQLRQEAGGTVLDTVIVIKNTNSGALRLDDCALELALLPNDSEEIALGSVQKESILLKPQTAETVGSDGNDVELSIHVADVQQLQQRLITSPEVAALLTETEPGVNFRLQGRFNLGMKGDEAWVYKEGIKIDWVVTPSLQRDILVNVIAEMDSGKLMTQPLQTATASTSESEVNPSKDNEARNIPENDEKQAEHETPEDVSVTDASSPKRSQSDQGERLHPITIYFSRNSIELRSEGQDALESWKKQLGDMPEDMVLHIEGHTDKSGSAEKNQEFSTKRAEAVFHYLIRDLNITQYPVYCIEGLASKQPAADSSPKDKGAKDRRVEVFFMKKK